MEDLNFGGLRISSLLFLDDSVLLASLGRGLQLAPGWFASKCEVAGMKMSTFKSEAMVFSKERAECSLPVRDDLLPQVEEFSYLKVFFMNKGTVEREVD